ncbi:hypothetical protein C9J03_04905 [Photobacterium gaetbulicola]|nr:hypothetical protein [Photobacterium gaetbulicola]PSU13769.1 hypothetical protein C9J03_04905 [Photobacterium gaetbulicola]
MINTIDNSFIRSVVPKTRTRSTIQVQDIKSKKARNLVRGIDPSSHRSTKKALEKIKHNCKYSDYKKALQYIKTSPIFDNNDIGQLFNEHCPKGMPSLVEFSPREITFQIDCYSSKLLEISEKAEDIVKYLKDNDLISALNACNEMVDLKGTSIFLIRMLSYITNRYNLLSYEDNEVLSKIDFLKSKIQLSKCSFVEEAVTQLSNLRTSHLAICKRINDFSGTFPYGYIAKSFIKPIPQDSKEFDQTLSAFYSFSLFDAFLYFKMIISQDLPFLTKLEIKDELSSAYEKITCIDFLPDTMYESIDESSGYYYLRECFLFVEQPKALEFLTIHGYYYSDFSNNYSSISHVKNLIDRYFLGLNSLNQLKCSNFNEVHINWDKYESSTCGMLENSTALIHLLTKKQGHLDEEEQLLFVKLMSFSRDVGQICHPDYLLSIANSAKDNQLKLVTQCLITINKNSQYNEHQLRSTIQNYCINEFNSDLIELLKYLYDVSPAVAEHLLQACNETFLCTLFLLVEKPVDALQLRADMLHWFGEKTDDERYIDRAKTLRIDIQINKERGTIDDSRIYVDPLKFTQWFEDNMVSKLTMALDNLIIGSQFVKLDWSKKNASLGTSEEIIDSILNCYKEFCENKVFGIASYLGRRIRHGTFKGTAITEVKNLPKKEEYQHLFEDKDFKNKFDEWMLQYESMIEDLVKTHLQIKSKRKPHGLITTSIDSPIKNTAADQLIIEILNIYSKRSGVIRLPSLITDCCWKLVDYDLTRTKKLLSEMKSSHGVFSYTPKNYSNKFRRQYSKFTQEVNSITGQKFGLMASWFNKPNYASPSTDIYLLFNVVVSEVKDSVSNFNPVIDLDDRNFSVNGGTYYVIYDALYVLVHNTARHGKSDGKILFSVSKPEDRNAIKINLMSEVDSYEALNHAKEQIEKGLKITDNDDDAHIIEGKSGLKKLRKLEKEGSISNISFMTDEENTMLCFEFYFELSSRGKYNDIDS